MFRRIAFSLYSQVLLILLTFVLLSTVALGWLAFHTSRNNAKRDAIRSMSIAANARQQILLRSIKQHGERARAFLNISVADCEDGENARTGCLHQLLKDFLVIDQAVAAQFLDHDSVITVGRETDLLKEISFTNHDQIAKFVSGGKRLLYYGIRVNSEDGDQTLILLFDLQDLSSIFLERYGLGNSGETFLVDSNGYFITPPKYPGAPGMDQPIATEPLKRCLSGQNGETMDRDYRGVHVVMAFRHIPEIGGGCVMAHIETAEAFAPALQLRREIAGIGALFAAFAIGLSFALARGFARPIDRLTERVRGLQRGDFESEVPIEGPAELRTFAETFNTMSGSLKKSRAALIRSEERVRAVLENALDAVVGMDEKGKIIDWNPQAEALFGWSRKEILGNELSEMIVPPRFREAHKTGLARFIVTGEGPLLNKRIEIDALRRDGSEFPVELSVTPIRTEDSLICYAFISDISGRREAERQIRFQAHLLAVVDQAVIATDLEGVIIYWNRFAESLYGWSAAEVLGRNIADIIPSNLSQQEAIEILSRLKRGESWSGEFVVRRRDGTAFPAMATDTPIRSEDGSIIGIVGVSFDMTRQKKTEEALREAHDQLEEKMIALQKQLDLSQVLHRISSEFALQKEIDLFYGEIVKDVAKLTGASKCTLSLIDPGGRALNIRSSYGFDEALILRMEMPILPEKGDPIHRLLSFGETLILDPSAGSQGAGGERYRALLDALQIRSALLLPLRVRGESIGIMSIYDPVGGRPFTPEDIQISQTIANQIAVAISNVRYYENLQKTNMELTQKTIEAQEANRMKTQFLSNVSHELRTPLNAIIGYTSLLLDQTYGAIPQNQRTPLEGVKRNASDLLKLVNDVLDLSRIESGKFEVKISEVDLDSLMEDIFISMKPLFDEEGLSVDCRVQENLPPIYSDAGKIKQILVNILSNAVKFSKKGGVQIEVRDLPERGGVEIAVQDTGIGIRKEDIPKIFDPFHQVDATVTREFGGVGLGLAIVKEILEHLKGKISVQSEYQKGSTFTLFFPYQTAPASPGPS